MLVPTTSNQRLSGRSWFADHWLLCVGTLLFAAVMLLIDASWMTQSATSEQAEVKRGLGQQLFLMLCLTPFHLIVLSSLAWVVQRARGLQNLPLRRDGRRWLVLPTNGQPLAVAAIVLGVLSIPSMMLAHASDWSDDPAAMFLLWLVLLSLSVLAFVHTRSLVRHETPTVILDDNAAEVIWPASSEQPAVTVPLSRLRQVAINDAASTNDTTDASLVFSVAWQFTDADGHPAERVVFKTRRGLETVALAEWLEDWATQQRTARPVANP